MRTGVDRRGITVLSLGHGAVDLAQGAVPALLPFFIHRYGYSYAEASALLLASTGSSSLIQPLFGYLADRRPVPWLLPVGVFLAAGGIACAGLLQNFWLTFLFISLSGLGAGSYHPEAARYANYVSGSRSASGGPGPPAPSSLKSTTPKRPSGASASAIWRRTGTRSVALNCG